VTYILYGIPNCDTVKKARVWLEQNGVDVAFHDYKKQGVEGAMLERWIAAHGWEAVLNS
jgi:arsenate reductase (glutaredoxin)